MSRPSPPLRKFTSATNQAGYMVDRPKVYAYNVFGHFIRERVGQRFIKYGVVGAN
jgi:hypothetical protein